MEVKTRRIYNHFAHSLVLAFALLPLVSCHKQLEPTPIQVVDSIRHYPSITLGDELVLMYIVRNIGNEVLVITDVQPSAPTIEPSAANANSIPPGEETVLKFTYNSSKNVGLARLSIRLFGNIAPKGEAELFFDTHVVRPSIDLSDYEEYYQKKVQTEGENLLDGDYTQKGYVAE